MRVAPALPKHLPTVTQVRTSQKYGGTVSTAIGLSGIAGSLLLAKNKTIKLFLSALFGFFAFTGVKGLSDAANKTDKAIQKDIRNPYFSWYW